MNTKIVCQNISIELISKAFNLGAYNEKDENIVGVRYKIYKRGDELMIEFEEEFRFCDLIFVMVDLFETTRNESVDILGFVDTDPSNKITEYLKGERICLYIVDDIKLGLQANEELYLDLLDLVTESNKHYSIDFQNLFSYTSEDKRQFNEPDLKSFKAELIQEGKYLYEKTDFEAEHLEDLKEARELYAKSNPSNNS